MTLAVDEPSLAVGPLCFRQLLIDLDKLIVLAPSAQRPFGGASDARIGGCAVKCQHIIQHLQAIDNPQLGIAKLAEREEESPQYQRVRFLIQAGHDHVGQVRLLVAELD